MNLPIGAGLPLRIHFLHRKSHRMMARWINSHACNAEAAPPPDVSQIWIQTTPYDKHFWKKKTQESQGYSQSGTSQSRYLPNKYTRAAPNVGCSAAPFLYQVLLQLCHVSLPTGSWGGRSDCQKCGPNILLVEWGQKSSLKTIKPNPTWFFFQMI